MEELQYFLQRSFPLKFTYQFRNRKIFGWRNIRKTGSLEAQLFIISIKPFLQIYSFNIVTNVFGVKPFRRYTNTQGKGSGRHFG